MERKFLKHSELYSIRKICIKNVFHGKATLVTRKHPFADVNSMEDFYLRDIPFAFEYF